MEVSLIGDIPNKAKVIFTANGRISCDYKNANDFNTPEQRGIKDATELEELSSKAHSIYNVFEEICNEYNENITTESK